MISNGADPSRSWDLFGPGEVSFRGSHRKYMALGLAGALHPLFAVGAEQELPRKFGLCLL